MQNQKKYTRNNCISCNFNFQALDLSGINRLSVYSYLILILITLNSLCEKVTAGYKLYPYIFFLKDSGILVKTAVQKTEVCSFLLTHNKCKISAKPPHHQQGFTLNLGAGGKRIQLALFMQAFLLLERLPK